MPENASHIFIYHHIDSSSNLNFTNMACCIILIVVVILLLVIIVGVIIFVITNSKNCRISKRQSHSRQSSKSRDKYAFDNLGEEVSSCNAVSTEPSTTRDFDENANLNVQSIPLSNFERQNRTNDRGGDSSESSAGLYDVLFPEQHDGEIIFQRPTKLVTFAGQVYPSSKEVKPENLDTAPSSSGINCEAASGSLEWDYFEPNSQVASENSEFELAVDPKTIYDVCWV